MTNANPRPVSKSESTLRGYVVTNIYGGQHTHCYANLDLAWGKAMDQASSMERAKVTEWHGGVHEMGARVVFHK